jgi:tripartite ATP-independent transporter DctM subunit
MAESELYRSTHPAGGLTLPVGQRSSPQSALGSLLANGFEAATILVMAALVVVVALAVFFRYVVSRPIAGSDEIATLLLVWLTFLGGAVGLRRRMHPSVNLVLERLPGSIQIHVEVFTRLLELIFFTAVAWHSLAAYQLRRGEPSAGAGFDMSLYPLALIVGVSATLLLALGQFAALPKRPLMIMLLGFLALAGLTYLSIQGGLLQPARFNPTLLMIGGFALLLVLNAPLAIALGLPSLIYLQILGGPNLLMLPQRLIAGADNFVLLAIPLFILAGLLMETGGISRRLVALAMALVGHLRGGLAQVTVVGEVMFSGISGSTTADVAAMGSLLIPSMEKAGYKKEEAVAIVSAASAMGILVPPCLLMVIIAAIADISVTALFLAGFLPAAVLALTLMLLIYFKARIQNWPVATRASLRGLGHAALRALIPLMVPIIIFGSIFSGAATVTESAVLAVLYALVVGLLVYRETPVRDLPRLFLDSAVLSAISMWLVASAAVFTWLLARNQVPQLVSAAILSVSGATWFFILASILIFIFFAALLEGFPAVIILGPIFYPIASQMGMSTLHFSIIIVACVGIGLFLPPVGIGLFVAAGIARTTMTKVTGYFLPYLGVLMIGLLIVAFIPWITTVLPDTFLIRR